MFRLLVLSSILAGAFAFPSRNSRVPLLDGRIVGGDTVTIDQYNYQVSLMLFGSHYCGGSLIASNVVVTAGVCTDRLSASSLSIRAGSSFRTSGGISIPVSIIHQHPNFNLWTVDYDISVLVLESSFTLSANIGLIGLPSLNQEIPANVDSVVTGWGLTSEGGSAANQLQRVVVQTISQVFCRAAYGESAITDRMFCAGALGVGSRDVCEGDGGGPLVISSELIGIASWGYGCARPLNPGVYASVPALRDYIASTVGI